MTNTILVVGKVRCPDGPAAPRREIELNATETAKLPPKTFVPCPVPRKRNCQGTKVTLVIDEDKYHTRFHRFAKTSFIADGTRIMRFHLKEFLERRGLADCGTELKMEVQVQGDCLRFVLLGAGPSSPSPSQQASSPSGSG